MIEIVLPLLEGSIFDMSLLSAVHLALCLASPIHACIVPSLALETVGHAYRLLTLAVGHCN